MKPPFEPPDPPQDAQRWQAHPAVAAGKRHSPKTGDRIPLKGVNVKVVSSNGEVWDKEMVLACPMNKLGKVSLYQATMHGFFNDCCGAPAHLEAIVPQVVIVNNGPRKGLLPLEQSYVM